MNQFLSRFALKHAKLGLSHTWVLAAAEQNVPAPISAYYTLASATVAGTSLPTQKSLPRYPIPVVLLARLAIDKDFQGQQLGSKTLISALRKAYELTSTGLPAIGVILDVLDEDALGFYRHFDFFEPFADDPMRLFVGMSAIADL